MRFLKIGLLLGSLGVILFAGFNNFAPIDQLKAKAKLDLKNLKTDIKELTESEEDQAEEAATEKEYVQIDGKMYEKNSRGVYYIDGVPTFVKNGKKAPPPKPTAKNPNLGPPIDPLIYKDAMGLDENEEFFKPRREE